MRKLYGKDCVHRLPRLTSNQLALFPATILTLTAALSLEDREVLAYLISCSSDNNQRNTRKTSGGGEHPPCFNCNCFSCYMSYWVRWDSSPNRQLIHEIIDAVEIELVQSKKDKNKKKRERGCNGLADELKQSKSTSVEDEFALPESVDKTAGGSGGKGDEKLEKVSVRKFVSLIRERIWSVWT
ncbi:uncharacterized protein LOC132267440 [Cornus florida]|uniref:uncharacterized protein LOC132267440 n=1 Tax=Cornus florida TaxID=4283 RepID=UPI0028968904|nr:uncharacterized protein LOC132267440 [Cornus florida]